MKRYRITPVVFASFTVILSAPFRSTLGGERDTPPTHLTLIDVPGTSGFIGTQANGINSEGDIVGVYVTDGFHTHGFLLRKGEFTTIDAPGASFLGPPTSSGTAASGINEQGDIVGSFNDAADNIHGYVLHNGVFTIFDAPTSNITNPTAINSQGDIVGSYFRQGVPGGTHSFLLRKGTFTTIEVPGATYTQANAINSRGDIVGFYVSNDAFHGFLFRNGTFTTIDLPGGTPGSTQASGINAEGEIVGNAGIFIPKLGFAVLAGWRRTKDGTFTELIQGPSFDPFICQCDVIPSGINERGDMVGSDFALTGVHGFLLSNK